jgi:hypothetical protein
MLDQAAIHHHLRLKPFDVAPDDGGVPATLIDPFLTGCRSHCVFVIRHFHGPVSCRQSGAGRLITTSLSRHRARKRNLRRTCPKCRADRAHS